MARNVRVVTGPAYAPQDRAEAFADALTARALRSRAPQQGGPVQVAMNPWEGVAQLGEAGIAALLSRKSMKLAEADHQRKLAANDQMIRQLAGTKTEDRAPMATYGQQVPNDEKINALTSAMAGMDQGAANQVLSGQVLQNTFAKPKYERVDLGDSIGVIDESGNVVQRIPKGYTPDAQLREGGENARWQTPSGNARLGSQTTMRGQDIGAQTQMRGQDMTYGSTIRGQDMSAETQRRGQDLTAGNAAAATGANPMGYNSRQMSGLTMQQSAAITYAANISGKTQDEIRQILATEGPEGVKKVIVENGDRMIQGGSARMLQALPFIGTPILEAMNADLIAPRTAGGAGIALTQNPTGPIATADFQAGEKQFPGPTYPLKDQANMVADMLSQGQAGAPQPPVTATGPNGEKIALVNGQWVPVNGQ